jgi:hypothetical protein
VKKCTYTKSNIRLDLPQNGGLVVRTIPSFETKGHIVKLEAMAEVAVQNSNPNYGVSVVISLLRDGFISYCIFHSQTK